MLVKPATTRECEYFFRRRFPRKRRLFPHALITLVQSGSSKPATGSGTVSLSSTVGAGDLIIVGINWGNFAGTYAVSDSAGNTYTQFPSVQIGISGFNDLNAFWAINTSSQSSITVTVNITGGGTHGMRLSIFDYSSSTGWLASPVDQGNSQHNATAGPSGNPGNITPTVAGTLAWSAIQLVTSGATAIIVTSPYTERPTSGGTAGTGWTSDARADSGDNQSASTSSQTCSFSWSSINSGYSSLIANFIPAAGNPILEDNSVSFMGYTPDGTVSHW